MKAYALDLLDFVEEKIAEAERDVASRTVALSKAAGAFPIIKDRLYHEDQAALAKFMLLGLFEVDFDRLGRANESQFGEEVRQLRERVQVARAVLQIERSST
ncbi:MAG: hypothetical protein ACOY5F_11575 [Pseudomonadota bacterium]